MKVVFMLVPKGTVTGKEKNASVACQIVKAETVMIMGLVTGKRSFRCMQSSRQV